MMIGTARLRLSTMFFLEYFGMGVTFPIISLYLRDTLHFSGMQTGVVLAMASVAAFVAPVVGALVADRVIAKERLLALCQVCAAVFLALLAYQTRYGAVVLLYLGYNVVFGPTIALASAITFHHMSHARHYFGSVRLWGTVGWIAAAWLFSAGWLGCVPGAAVRDAFVIAAVTSVVLAGHMLLHHPVERLPGAATVIPWEALRIVWQRRMLLMALIVFLASFFIRYYYVGAAPFLAHRGVRPALIMPLMSLGQISEIGVMLLLSAIVPRLGYQRSFMLGACLALWQSAVFALNAPWPFLISGFLCHGLMYALVNVTALMYVDSFCPREARAGVHQIFSIVGLGLATLSGSVVAGMALDWAARATGGVDYGRFWLVNVVVAALLLALAACSGPLLKDAPRLQRV